MCDRTGEAPDTSLTLTGHCMIAQARRRASERLSQREAEELARVRAEERGKEGRGGGGGGGGGGEEEKEDAAEAAARVAEVLRHSTRAASEEERGQATPYETLGLDPRSCTQSDIRRAYRKLTLALHPDKRARPVRSFRLTSSRHQISNIVCS